MANAPKDVRQSTKATVSTVISTVLVPGFAISTKKNNITKSRAVNILPDLERNFV